MKRLEFRNRIKPVSRTKAIESPDYHPKFPDKNLCLNCNIDSDDVEFESHLLALSFACGSAEVPFAVPLEFLETPVLSSDDSFKKSISEH